MAAQTTGHSRGSSRFALTRPADLWVFFGTLLTAWFFDLSAQSGRIGLGMTGSLLIAAAALLLAGRPRNGWSRILLTTAAVIAPWLTVRASPWLQWPDLVVTVGLLTGAATLASGGNPFELSFTFVRERIAQLLANLAQAAAFITAPLSVASERLTRDKRPTVKQVGRGLAIAIPVACVIGFLLASADPVFASFFNLQIDPASLIGHAFWLAIAGVFVGGLLRTSLTVVVEEKAGRLWRVDPLEAIVVLVVLDAIFLAFGLAQLITALGGGVEALRAANMTYADYARSGFFQLLAVAAITLPVLLVLTTLSGSRSRRMRFTFTFLVELAVLLTIAIVAVAHQRLSLYEAAYGFTMLRLYSHIFAIWIAIVFVMFGAIVLRAESDRQRLPGAAAAAGLVLLLALNIVNPEAAVVRLNVGQSSAGHLLDRDYLAGLSDDAVPELFRALPVINPTERGELRRQLCQRPQARDDNWAGYNLSQQAAQQAHASCS